MAKIVIIGAGSGFGGKLSVDILCRKPLQDSTIALCDIDQGRLEMTAAYVQRTIDRYSLPAKVITDTDRRRLMDGADFVVTSISVGGRAYWGKPYHDEIHIPRKYGLDQDIGDTIGPAGVFRFLRTAPVQLEICWDMEEICPSALLLNYTNPMAMLTWAHSEGSGIANVGLCHSVQGTTQLMAKMAGIPYSEVSYLVAGINHQAWVLEFCHKGQDAYPLVRAARENPQFHEKERIRFEILWHFDYFVTESSRHNSEYVPYFRRTPELRDKYKLRSREVKMDAPVLRDWLKDLGEGEEPAVGTLKPSVEYASGIMEATLTNQPMRFNGNLMNTGLIDNLPAGCCVEAPCLADARGIHGCHVGALPAHLAAINRSNIAVHELAVRAVLNRDRRAAFHACCLDPLTAATLDLDQIQAMFDELWEAEKHLLTWFE
jgi:alpha-galactosidase